MTREEGESHNTRLSVIRQLVLKIAVAEKTKKVGGRRFIISAGVIQKIREWGPNDDGKSRALAAMHLRPRST